MVLAGLLFLISLVGHTEASCQTNIEATSPRHKRSTSDCAECCEDVCLTVDCIKEAAQISRSLDKTADPCDNFVNYACGIYFKTNRIRKDRVVVNPFQTMKYDNNKLMKDAILTEIKPTDRPFQRWPKMYFKSCMNTAQIEKIGLQPYLDTTFAKEWPTLLGSAWQNSTNFDIADLNAKYSAVMSNPLILMGSYRNLKNNSNYDIFVGGTGPLGISAGHLTTPRNGTILMAHEKLLRDMAIELGAEPSVAAKDAATYVDMAVALVKIIHRTRKFEETVNEFTMETLPENMTFMDIPRAIRSTFGTMNIRIPRNQKVVIWDYKLSYFNSLEKVLRSYTERDIRNLFGFIYARQRVLVTQKMLDILFELNKVLYDQRLRNSRFDECYRETLYYFQIILSNEFIRHLYSVHERQETKQKVSEMAENIRNVLLEQLDQVSWMRNTTKAAAIEKTKVMRLRISHPEKGFGEDALDNDPDLMNITEDNYYKNVVLCMIRDYRQELRNLGKTPGKSWNPRFPPNRVNAFYHPQENTIYVLAGILQQPMFSSRNLLAHNYGAIGSLIGHEIIHGFDATGSQFDSHGNLRNWWEDEDKERFQNATQCFIDQYNNYTYPQLKGKTYVKQNATNSVGEIVADSCGIKQSYHAYRKLVSQVGEEEKLLSGLGLSPDQLFFVGYAQAWCSKETNAALIARLLSRSHPHATYRILSTLWNFPEFSQTFNCSLGSPMNPERKCSLFGD